MAEPDKEKPTPAPVKDAEDSVPAGLTVPEIAAKNRKYWDQFAG